MTLAEDNLRISLIRDAVSASNTIPSPSANEPLLRPAVMRPVTARPSTAALSQTKTRAFGPSARYLPRLVTLV